MNKKLQLALGVLLLGSTAPLFAQGVGDCDFYQNSAAAEPEWYADSCLGGAGKAAPLPAVTKAPSDPAIAFNFSTFAGDPGRISSHPMNDFANQTNLAVNTTELLFSFESDSTGTVIYGIDSNSGNLGTFDPATGAFTSIGTPTPTGAESFSGLAINQAGAFALSTDVTNSSIYSIDLATGATTLIGTDTVGAGMIDFAITCAGEMYGHDIVTDSIYSIDPATGAHTLIGATGIDANFAQGMTLDRETGTIYVHGYTGGGTNTYGSVDLGTGAIVPISVDNPLGEFVGATTTSCAPPVPEIIPTLGTTGLAVLLLALAGIAVFTMRRRRTQ